MKATVQEYRLGKKNANQSQIFYFLSLLYNFNCWDFYLLIFEASICITSKITNSIFILNVYCQALNIISQMSRGGKNVPAPKVYTGRLAGFDPSAYANQFVTEDQVLEIKKSFDLFDYDGGGSIDPKELKESINSLGIEAKAEAVWHMIAEIDADGSGQLEFDEFFTMMTTRPSENETREEIHKVFVTYDLGRTGYIALKDLRKVSKDLGELTDDNVLQEMIERADFDQDGLVSEEEFYNLMTKKA